jgi:hypothetical protein
MGWFSYLGRLVFRLVHRFPQETRDGYALIHPRRAKGEPIPDDERRRYVAPDQQVSFGLHLLAPFLTHASVLSMAWAIFPFGKRESIDQPHEYVFVVLFLMAFVFFFYCVWKLIDLSQTINTQIHDE